MYGFVNYALELLVLKHFGESIWEQIKHCIGELLSHLQFVPGTIFRMDYR